MPSFVGSAWLVAATCTVAGDGRSAGAVYTPPDVTVPSAELPPGTPLTLQLTTVSVVFVTVAPKVVWSPSTTETFAGFTVTSIAGGGGGGGEALPPPHPNDHQPWARIATITIVVALNLFAFMGERNRMPSQKQAKGQRKKGALENGD